MFDTVKGDVDIIQFSNPVCSASDPSLKCLLAF